MKTIAVVPALNEAPTIAQVVAQLKPMVDEVVVIDDGSWDDTARQARAAGAMVVSHLLNRGQGAALRTGTLWALAAGADLIVHFDADGQFTAGDLPTLLAPLKAGQADIVFGSRFLRAGNRLPPGKRYLIMPLARLINRLFGGVRLTDPQSGLRAFTATAFAKISWQEDRMAHCSEILWQAERHGLRIKEVPMTVIYSGYGQKFGSGLKILGDLLINKLIR
jgi:glycosyltransferase involved in cell wall biosynthesis